MKITITIGKFELGVIANLILLILFIVVLSTNSSETFVTLNESQSLPNNITLSIDRYSCYLNFSQHSNGLYECHFVGKKSSITSYLNEFSISFVNTNDSSILTVDRADNINWLQRVELHVYHLIEEKIHIAYFDFYIDIYEISTYDTLEYAFVLSTPFLGFAILSITFKDRY